MGLRSRVGDTLVRVGKTFGASVPASFTEGEQASQMTPAVFEQTKMASEPLEDEKS